MTPAPIECVSQRWCILINWFQALEPYVWYLSNNPADEEELFGEKLMLPGNIKKSRNF